MRKIILLFIGFWSITLGANNDALIAEIETNNLSLKALRQKTEALSAENLSEVSLEDPSFEFAYLWGPEGIRRKDISFSQSFDYATLSGIRKDKALSENDLLQIEYKIALRDIQVRAKELINEIIYRNALIAQYEIRLKLARQNEEAYKKGFELGEFSIIDYRNASMELTQVQNSYNMFVIERESLLDELTVLNGGKVLEITDTELIIPLIPKDFGLWLEEASQNSRSLQYYHKATNSSQQELRLRQSEAVPSISVGYVAELVPESNFRGIQFGINIPLWSSTKRIKAAKMKVEASQTEEEAAIIEFGLRAKSLYDKALRLSEMAINLIDETFIFEVEEALNSGEISIIDSIERITAYYDTIELNLSTKLDCILTINELESL